MKNMVHLATTRQHRHARYVQLAHTVRVEQINATPATNQTILNILETALPTTTVHGNATMDSAKPSTINAVNSAQRA